VHFAFEVCDPVPDVRLLVNFVGDLVVTTEDFVLAPLLITAIAHILAALVHLLHF